MTETSITSLPPKTLRPTGDPFRRVAGSAVQQIPPSAAVVRPRAESVDPFVAPESYANALAIRYMEPVEAVLPRAQRIEGQWEDPNTVIHVSTFLSCEDIPPLALTSRGIRAILYADPPSVEMLKWARIAISDQDVSDEEGLSDYKMRAAEATRLGRTPISEDDWLAAKTLFDKGPEQLVEALRRALTSDEEGEQADPIQLILDMCRVRRSEPLACESVRRAVY